MLVIWLNNVKRVATPWQTRWKRHIQPATSPRCDVRRVQGQVRTNYSEQNVRQNQNGHRVSDAFIKHILSRLLHSTEPGLDFDTIVYLFYISKCESSCDVFLDTFLLYLNGKTPIFLPKYHHMGAVLSWHLMYVYKVDVMDGYISRVRTGRPQGGRVPFGWPCSEQKMRDFRPPYLTKHLSIRGYSNLGQPTQINYQSKMIQK